MYNPNSRGKVGASDGQPDDYTAHTRLLKIGVMESKSAFALP